MVETKMNGSHSPGPRTRRSCPGVGVAATLSLLPPSETRVGADWKGLVPLGQMGKLSFGIGNHSSKENRMEEKSSQMASKSCLLLTNCEQPEDKGGPFQASDHGTPWEHLTLILQPSLARGPVLGG